MPTGHISVGIFVCIKKKDRKVFLFEKFLYFYITIATKLFLNLIKNEKINHLHYRTTPGRSRMLVYGFRLHYLLHRGLFPSSIFYRVFRMIWRMRFRYHETGSYFVTMTFANIREANRYIKQEEAREQSEFLDYKLLTHYGINK